MPNPPLTGIGRGSPLVRITGLYALFGLLLIWLSDGTLWWLGHAGDQSFLASALKGIFFIAGTAAFLYWLMWSEFAGFQRSESLLRSVAEGTSDAAFDKDGEARFRRLIDAIPQIVWTAGLDGALTHVNARAAEYSGLNASDLTGWSWERLIHPNDRDSMLDQWKLTLGDGVPRPIESRMRRADGAYRWHISRQLPIHDAAGEIVSWVGTNTDIDDLKQAERTLRETDTRLREAQRIARLGSWSWEPPTDRVWWSNAEFELFCIDRQSVIPNFEAFLSLLHPDDRAVAITRVEAMKAGADEFAHDLRIIRPDGSTMWIHSRARATRDSDGALIRVEGTDQDITAQRMAEVAARESEERLQAAVEVAGLGIIVVDYERQSAKLSPRAAEQFGFPPEASVNRADLHARFHPDDKANLDRVIANALTPGGTGGFDLEHRVVLTDGTIRWLNVRKQVSFADGRPHRAVVVTADVTSRRLGEEALRSSEARYRLMFESNPHPMWVFDVDSLRFLAVNDAAVQTYGYSRDEFLSMTIRDIRPPEDVPRLELTIAKLTPGLNHSPAWRHVRKDGTLFNVDVSVHDLLTGDGRSRLVVALDVTERSRAEEARDELLARLQLHIDRMPIAYVFFDSEIRYANWNPAAEKIFGYSRDEVLGQSVQFLVHPDDRAHVDAITFQLRAGEVAAHSINRNVTKDGRVITCEWHNTPLFAPNGEFLGILSMTLDITERVRAEEALRESEQRLRLALEAAGAIAFVWDIKCDAVTRYFSVEPALPITAGQVVTLNDVRVKVHPDDLPRFDTRLASALAEGNEYRNEYRVVRPDGTTAFLHEYGYLDRTADGTPLRLIGMSIDVTDRVAASEALRQSEDRLAEAARVAGFGVFEHDNRTGDVFWSARLRDIYGFDQEAPASLDAYLGMIHPEERDTIAAAVCRAHDPTGDGRFEVNHRLIRPNDGRVRRLATQSQTWFTGNGPDRRPVRTVGATVDVTDAWEAAEALRESERRFRQLVDVLPESLFVDVDDRITYCNPAFVRLMGAASADELLGLSPYDVVHSDYHQAIRPRTKGSIETGFQTIATEMRVVRRDGRAVPVYAVSSGISESGQQAVLVVLSDLTERERATQLLRTVLGSVSDAILTIDERGVVRSVNPAAARQFGYSEDELVGGNVSVLMPEPYCSEHDEYLANYRQTGVAKVIGIGREVECRRRDGTQFWAELTVTEFSLEDVRHFTGVLRDITERKRLQSQFIQAQKMEAVGRLAGGVAHDFNNLLTIINGYCDLLMMSDLPAADDWQESVASIRDAGERAARLTQQLLAFSRKAIIEPKVFDLSELVTESAKLLRRLIGEDIILAVITAPAPILVTADQGQLEQVIMNLVVNARDAMPTGGRLTIQTTMAETAKGATLRFAQLSVSDTGHGMTNEVKGKIFEPFFTTKEVGKGTGLGLAVVHGIVTQSGGHIAIESTVGVGTTFHLFLPALTEETSDTVADATRLAAQGHETILLVEDEAAVRKIARISLQTQGYTVLEAESGTEAIRQAETYPGEIHLLLSDVVMPYMGGRQLLEVVRRHRPGLRVLFMSGYTDDAVLLHGVVGTSDAFIQKPFTPLGLARKVREVINSPAK